MSYSILHFEVRQGDVANQIEENYSRTKDWFVMWNLLWRGGSMLQLHSKSLATRSAAIVRWIADPS